VKLKQKKIKQIVMIVMPKKRHHKIALFANQDIVTSRHMRPVIIAPQDMKESVYARSFRHPTVYPLIGDGKAARAIHQIR
jgi:hypothetical protein